MSRGNINYRNERRTSVMDEGLIMCHGLGCVGVTNTLCIKLQVEIRKPTYECRIIFWGLDWLPLYPHKIRSYPYIANLLIFFIPSDVAAENLKWKCNFLCYFPCPLQLPLLFPYPHLISGRICWCWYDVNIFVNVISSHSFSVLASRLSDFFSLISCRKDLPIFTN